MAPAVDSWLGTLIGNRSEGVADLSTAWEGWRAGTKPPILPSLVTAGREAAFEECLSWLRDQPKALAVQGDSPEEALAFFLGGVQNLSEETRADILSRALLVHTGTDWHRLVASQQRLLLIPTFEDRSILAIAIQRGHHVLLLVGPEDSPVGNAIQLPRLPRELATIALEEMGLSHETAYSEASLVRRSLLSFRRKYSVIPALQNPGWASSIEARNLLAALLAGSWNTRRDGDHEILEQLSGRSYEELETALTVWTRGSDPPVRHIGDVWLLSSKEDAWNLLSKYLTRADYEKLEKAVLQVLGERHPAFDVEANQRYMAPILGYESRYSGVLKRGFADTLAVMGARGRSRALGEAMSVSDYAGLIIRRLLDHADQRWEIWASLDSVFPLLAEAAPEEFLAQVEEHSNGPDSIIVRLFTEAEGMITPITYHCGLLWALEGLAWNPEYLARTALLLAKLARHDPGGRMSNRPGESLTRIFLPWYPQTSAPLEQRLRVLDTIVRRESKVGFELLVSLLPKAFRTTRPTHKPRWRDWAPDDAPKVSGPEYWKGIEHIAKTLVDTAGTSGELWLHMIGKLDDLPKEVHETAVQRLRTLPLRSMSTADRTAVWNALRELISKHREFPDADWSMPAEYVNRLAAAYRRFEPRDIIYKYEWLFSAHPASMRRQRKDFHANYAHVAAQRERAVTTIYKKRGLAGVRLLISRAVHPEEVGGALGRSGAFTLIDEDEFLRDGLVTEAPPLSIAASTYAFWRFRALGWDWANSKIETIALTPESRAKLLVALPYSVSVLDRVDELGDDVGDNYWVSANRFYWVEDPAEAVRIMTNLIKHRRPYTALDNITMLRNNVQIPPELIATVFEKALDTSTTDDPSRISGYHIGELLDLLEASGEIAEERIARLEWVFLPLFRHQSSRGPKLLHRVLQRDPEFFTQIVCYAYRSVDDEPDRSSEAELQARHAHELLDSWHTVPGLTAAGEVDGDQLREWVLRARDLLHRRGRRIADTVIGQVLRYAPGDAEGTWPPVPVRELIEELASENLEDGIAVEVYNSRGVVTKSPYAGGASERRIAATYREYAQTVRDQWPRTGAMLERIARTYEHDARREDAESEFRQDYE